MPNKLNLNVHDYIIKESMPSSDKHFIYYLHKRFETFGPFNVDEMKNFIEKNRNLSFTVEKELDKESFEKETKPYFEKKKELEDKLFNDIAKELSISKESVVELYDYFFDVYDHKKDIVYNFFLDDMIDGVVELHNLITKIVQRDFLNEI